MIKLNSAEESFLYKYLINFRTPSSYDSKISNSILEKICKSEGIKCNREHRCNKCKNHYMLPFKCCPYCEKKGKNV